MNKKLEQIYGEYCQEFNRFADNFANGLTNSIRDFSIDVIYKEYKKELKQQTLDDKLKIKAKNKMFKALQKAESKLVGIERADLWFENIFQEYYTKGLLEPLVVNAVLFLQKQELLVPKRLFAKLSNDELLADFTLAACNYLGWTQNDAAEQPTTDENETTNEQTEETETADSTEEQPQNEAESKDVTVYEPQVVQPVEQPTQPVLTVERTVTHEVMTATPQQGQAQPALQSQAQVADAGADNAEEQAPPSQSERKAPPSFYRPGGKSGNKQ